MISNEAIEPLTNEDTQINRLFKEVGSAQPEDTNNDEISNEDSQENVQNSHPLVTEKQGFMDLTLHRQNMKGIGVGNVTKHRKSNIQIAKDYTYKSVLTPISSTVFRPDVPQGERTLAQDSSANEMKLSALPSQSRADKTSTNVKKIRPKISPRSLKILPRKLDATETTADQLSGPTPEEEYIQLMERTIERNLLSPRSTKMLEIVLERYKSGKAGKYWNETSKESQFDIATDMNRLQEGETNKKNSLRQTDQEAHEADNDDPSVVSIATDTQNYQADTSKLTSQEPGLTVYVKSDSAPEKSSNSIHCLESTKTGVGPKPSTSTSADYQIINDSERISETDEAPFVSRIPKIAVETAQKTDDEIAEIEGETVFSLEDLFQEGPDWNSFKIENPFSDFSLHESKPVTGERLSERNQKLKTVSSQQLQEASPNNRDRITSAKELIDRERHIQFADETERSKRQRESSAMLNPMYRKHNEIHPLTVEEHTQTMTDRDLVRQKSEDTCQCGCIANLETEDIDNDKTIFEQVLEFFFGLLVNYLIHHQMVIIRACL